MTAVHTLTLHDLDAVAAGAPSADLLARLYQAQGSKRRLMLSMVQEAAEGRISSSMDDAIALLEAAHGAAPDAVADIIARPFTNVWAAQCLRDAEDPRLDLDTAW